jgi:hypothetical protein
MAYVRCVVLLALMSGVLAPGGDVRAAEAQSRAALTFCCSGRNDLLLALGKARFPRFDSPMAAIAAAAPGSAVLLLADEYPAHTVSVDAAVLELARSKELRLFIEYPAAVPGLEAGAPRTVRWERVVVASERFGPELPRLRILGAHDCHFIPFAPASREGASGVRAGTGGTLKREFQTHALNADLVVARVAGYDTACYGLPEKGVFPILFEVPEQKLLVAATKLSGFVTARFAPGRDWELVWERILAALASGGSFHLDVKPVVEAAYGPGARLPRRFQREAFAEAARWFGGAHLLVHPSEKERLYQALAAGQELTAPAGPEALQGDGSLGILEGYDSGILYDGTQRRRLPLRSDCHAESAMVLALDARLAGHRRNGMIASNLLDFVYFNSGMCQGARADPQNGAFGLIGWGDIAPAWLVANYGDDDARTMLATTVIAASLKTERWDERVMRALLANVRTTGKLGFRTDRLDLPALQQNGWKAYYDGAPVDYSPHFESYLWACYLWAYRQTGFPLFLKRANTAISMTMKVYPEQWRWQDNLERARMLLCLAWLVRVADTPEHREWLGRVAGDLLADQQASGAIHERLGPVHGGHFRTAQRNEDYGTGETPLLQENGDPVSDQLYTTGFALLGLHEAAGATGDPKLKRAEDKLAEFLCRIQTRSKKFDYLNGTWFRAFDDRRWETWASSGDVGWGAWSVESGWGQAWTAAVLGLRELHTTVWDWTAKSGVAKHFGKLKAQMLPETP